MMHRLKLKPMLSPILQRSLCSHVPFLFCLKINSFSSSSFSSSSLQCSPWTGLQTWRESPLNENRCWGAKGPKPHPLQSQPSSFNSDDSPMVSSVSSLAELGALVLSTSDPLAKSKLSHLAFSRWRVVNLPIGSCEAPPRPARPLKPQLVSPKEIPAPKNSVMETCLLIICFGGSLRNHLKLLLHVWQ